MRRKRTKGATLSLIVSLCLVIAMVGVGVFFLAKILGGARELQHAVDSGNLNVAKQALRSPSINIYGGNVNFSGSNLAVAQSNFSQSIDTTNGAIDLIVYNRLVAQAMLVAVNAAADNADLSLPPNALGIQHAKQLISCLSDPSTGIGIALANKLKTDVTMDNSFSGLATLAATRMLNAGSAAIGTVSADKDVSRMSRGQASNVIFPSNVLPSEFSFVDPSFNKTYSTSTTAGGSSQYLAGYESINIPGVTNASTVLCGVALHPLQNPHLVGSNDFNNNKTAIAGLSQAETNAVPPNSFKSGGMAEELKSAKILQTISCAVVGTVNPTGQFSASIPNGYLVVANGNSSGSLTPPSSAASESLPGPIVMDSYASGLVDSAYGGGTGDIFSDVLMANTVYVTPNGAMSEQVGTIQAIIDWKNTQIKANLPTTPVPANLANAIDGPNPKQSSADGIDPASGYVACTNQNSAPGDSSSNSTCVANLSTMADVYLSNTQGGTQGGSLAHLTAIEYEKAELINPRPGGGPANSKLAGYSGGGTNGNQPLPGNGVCTGMMAQPLASIPSSAAIDFGTTPTIATLIGPNSTFTNYSKTAANATTIYNQFQQRLYQLNPNVSAADITAVMTTAIPMGSVKYIYFDTTKNLLTISDPGQVPSWINTQSVQPDGSTVTADTGSINLIGTFVDISGEAGFPHPWDCEGGAWARSEAIWTRSSGYNGTLGVLRFTQCATDEGTEWRCPC
jgi:hypothetical protein